MKENNLHNQAVKHLSNDPVLKKVIKKHPAPKWGNSENLFRDIVENIIGQQLSGGPAEIITKRFIQVFPTKDFPEPRDILLVDDKVLRACGLTWAKVSYVKNLAQAVSEGSLDLAEIKKKPDQEVIIELTKIKGIGRWTAEMVLIFFLRRPDIFSLGDLGLRTAVSKLYGVDRNDLKKIENLSLSWSPYRSFASRYLWISLDNR